MPHSEFKTLIESLKQIMNSRRITYKQLSQKCSLSESAIKRFFNAKDGTLGKIQEILEALEISFEDLIAFRREYPFEALPLFLTDEQESFLAENIQYLALYNLLAKEMQTPDEIKKKYHLSQEILDEYLRKLESFGLLERLPKNQIKIPKGHFLAWKAEGPLQKAFLKKSWLKFVDDMIPQKSNPECFVYLRSAFMCPETKRFFLKEFKELCARLGQTARRDALLFSPQDMEMVTWSIVIGEYRLIYDDFLP